MYANPMEWNLRCGVAALFHPPVTGDMDLGWTPGDSETATVERRGTRMEEKSFGFGKRPGSLGQVCVGGGVLLFCEPG